MKKLFVVLFCVFVLFGCHPRVWLDQNRFQPQNKYADFPAYQGKDLQLTVYYQPANASGYFYYSNTTRTEYTTLPSMDAYLDGVIRKSAAALGMTVYVAPPQLRVIPELRIYVNSLSDAGISVEAQVLIDKGIQLSKIYTVTMPPPDPDASHESLEKRAYTMIDMLAAQIFGDARVRELVTREITGKPAK
jgi:hypothetical protein